MDSCLWHVPLVVKRGARLRNVNDLVELPDVADARIGARVARCRQTSIEILVESHVRARSWTSLVILLVLTQLSLRAAPPVIDATSASPTSVILNTPTPVLFTARITDPTVLPTGVNLLRTDASGKTLSTVGVMRDDGTNGDVAAGDKTFSLRVTVQGAAVGQIYYRVSAAFKGVIQRTLSAVMPIAVTNAASTPSITVSLTPPANANGWRNTPVTAHFTCTSPGSTVTSCPPDRVIYTEGAGQTVSGTMTDANGGTAAVTSPPFSIDLTAPSITVSVTPSGASGWNTSPVAADFTCADAVSGVSSCPTDREIATEGNGQTVGGTATDLAGNTASVTSATFRIDLTPPSISVSLMPAANGNGWNNSSVTAHFVCNDAGSGVAQCPADRVISSEGAPQPISGVASDVAGHTATTSATVSIDTTPPVVTLSQPTNGTTGTTVFTPSVAVTGTASDALSGIATATCNGSPAVVSAGALSCTASLTPGPNTVEAVVTDRAGNSSTSSQTFTYVRVPMLTITSPSNLSYTNITPTTISGTVDDPTATVTINSIQATVANGSFSLALPLAEGPNIVTATAASAAGAVGTATMTVTLDTTPPRVTVTSPPDQFETIDASLFVSGIVNDIVVGTINAEQAGVTVNGVAANVANRTFVANNVPLTLGTNVIQVVGRDRVGNQGTTQVTVIRRALTAQSRIELVSGSGQDGVIRSLLPAPLVVSLFDGSGAPAANKPVIFKVIQNDGLVASGAAPAATIVATTDSQGRAQAQWTLGGRAGAGGNTVEAYAVGFEGTAIFTATGTQGPAGKIVVDTGNQQFGPIGQRLPKPFIAVVVDDGNNRLAGVSVTFTVSEGGGDIDGQPSLTVVSDPDGRVAATLTLGTQEGNNNNVVSATFPSNQGFPAAFTSSGRAPGDPTKTSIKGVVLDNSNVPIPGVTIRAVQTEVLHANGNAANLVPPVTTDAEGQFTVPNAPVGYVELIVDGSTATPSGTYPTLDYDVVTIAGQVITVGQPIYLLPIKSANSLCVTDTTGGGTLTIPEAPGFSLTFGPGQVTFPGGSKTGCITVTVVNADKVPMSPGFGQQPRFIVTIQPAGASFNPPAPITLPNVDGLKPRAVTEMYSFDHDISSFVAIGTGTVSDDGLVIRSNAGVGVLKAGWHCGGNPNQPGTVALCSVCFFCPGSLGPCMPQGNGTPCGNGGTCQFGQGCVGGSACPAGYSFSDGQCCQGANCDLDPTCPPGQHPDPSGTCVNDEPCPPGYTLTGGQCCRDGICFEPSCPSGQVFDPATGTCQPYVETCAGQPAGQFCNAGGGPTSPGRCNAAGGCEGNSREQCGSSSGCSACVTTPGSGQQCTQCSNGQPSVDGQCEEPLTLTLRWRDQDNPGRAFIREGSETYVSSRFSASVSRSGGRFTWESSNPAVLSISSLETAPSVEVIGHAPGTARLSVEYVLENTTRRFETLVSVTYPTIFVHGMNSSGATWANVINALKSRYQMVDSSLFCDVMDSNVDFCAVDFSSLPLEGSNTSFFLEAPFLRDRVQGVLTATGASKVVLVAHSMGGLASRLLIEDYGMGPRIAKLVTIGTPHLGSETADLPLRLFTTMNSLYEAFGASTGLPVPTSSSVNSLRPASAELQALNSSPRLDRLVAAPTEYVSIVSQSVGASSLGVVAWNAMAFACEVSGVTAPAQPLLALLTQLFANSQECEFVRNNYSKYLDFFFRSDWLVTADSQDIGNVPGVGLGRRRFDTANEPHFQVPGFFVGEAGLVDVFIRNLGLPQSQ
jgi:pimeloyl-ACP methyl ester carboxylesterase